MHGVGGYYFSDPTVSIKESVTSQTACCERTFAERWLVLAVARIEIGKP